MVERKTKQIPGGRIEPGPRACLTDYDTTTPAPLPLVHNGLTIKLNGYVQDYNMLLRGSSYISPSYNGALQLRRSQGETPSPKHPETMQKCTYGGTRAFSSAGWSPWSARIRIGQVQYILLSESAADVYCAL